MKMIMQYSQFCNFYDFKNNTRNSLQKEKDRRKIKNFGSGFYPMILSLTIIKTISC